MNYGTIFVDLERRRVADLLADRTTATTADWFKLHPETEIVSRDRAGMYADAARQGAPQARQVADRFHLLKNLREAIERQLGGFEAAIREAPLSGAKDDQGPLMPAVSEQADQRSKAATRERLVRLRRDAARRAMFDQIRALYEAGRTVPEIARKLGLGPRRVYRWVRRIDMPETSVMAPKPCTPAYFGAFLARSWADGTTKSATCSPTFAILKACMVLLEASSPASASFQFVSAGTSEILRQSTRSHAGTIGGRQSPLTDQLESRSSACSLR